MIHGFIDLSYLTAQPEFRRFIRQAWIARLLAFWAELIIKSASALAKILLRTYRIVEDHRPKLLVAKRPVKRHLHPSWMNGS